MKVLGLVMIDFDFGFVCGLMWEVNYELVLFGYWFLDSKNSKFMIFMIVCVWYFY